MVNASLPLCSGQLGRGGQFGKELAMLSKWVRQWLNRLRDTLERSGEIVRNDTVAGTLNLTNKITIPVSLSAIRKSALW